MHSWQRRRGVAPSCSLRYICLHRLVSVRLLLYEPGRSHGSRGFQPPVVVLCCEDTHLLTLSFYRRPLGILCLHRLVYLSSQLRCFTTGLIFAPRIASSRAFLFSDEEADRQREKEEKKENVEVVFIERHLFSFSFSLLPLFLSCLLLNRSRYHAKTAPSHRKIMCQESRSRDRGGKT